LWHVIGTSAEISPAFSVKKYKRKRYMIPKYPEMSWKYVGRVFVLEYLEH